MAPLSRTGDGEVRLRRLDRAIQDQKRFLGRIPDPDTRDRAELHLFTMVEMRDALQAKQEAA